MGVLAPNTFVLGGGQNSVRGCRGNSEGALRENWLSNSGIYFTMEQFLCKHDIKSFSECLKRNHFIV